MEPGAKHYKFINSKTGNTIYYYTLSEVTNDDKAKQQLEAIKAEVAKMNGVFLETIYWEEIKE